MWDRLAGRYLTASRSTSRLSEVPTSAVAEHAITIAWDEASVIDSNPHLHP